ncbi:pseudouridine synthase [Ureibacillus sp. GCM10028918]|uniref:pseudouridine synthase n=1 Tax=Ureibacillus sp. GCM10028918 TaxID=3273429 RepID=UPI00360B0516
MRLDKLLANMGYGTRKEVKQLLKQKGVTVDGGVVKDASMHVNPDIQEVSVFGERVEYTEFIYLMMNKPPGVISATEDHIDKTVIDLLDPLAQHFKPFPVGRLDKDTEGLLLITNDGQLAHNLLSPKKHVPKTYYAKINGEVTESDIEAFKQGVELDDGYVTKPGELVILRSGPSSEIELTIQEGKFHQVKRMFESVEKTVTYLKRLSMGSLKLDEQLNLGDYRELTEEELNTLKNK